MTHVSACDEIATSEPAAQVFRHATFFLVFLNVAGATHLTVWASKHLRKLLGITHSAGLLAPAKTYTLSCRSKASTLDSLPQFLKS